MGPDALAHVLQPLTAFMGTPPDALLVGLTAADDAAVYRLNAEQAVVATLDFFPPVVDDPHAFGAIAATNALSDIYAMGGDPLFCLNVVAWPDELDADLLTDVIRGGSDKVREAGAIVAGGHSVIDHEPKFGLVAIGLVHPDHIFTKGGARPGDTLLLTKALGTGVITTAHKRDRVADDDLETAILSMTTLNRAASQALRTLGPSLHACTDVTGFGLLGHAWEMAEQSGVGMRITARAVPWLPGARAYAKAGCVPGGTERNRDALSRHVHFGAAVDEITQTLLYDPQTSGGLLVAVAKDAAGAAELSLRAAGVACHRVGEVVQGDTLVVE